MKRFILTAVVIFFASRIAYSTVRTVSNDPNLPAQFTTFDAAYAPSIPGDTIYLHGSNTAYTFSLGTISKAITIIGPGFNPEKQYRLTAKFTSPVVIGVSNVNLFGLYDQFGLSINGAFSNIRISRCYITSLFMNTLSSNITIDGCTFPVSYVLTISGNNGTFMNNVVSTFTATTGGGGTRNWTIDHNTFVQSIQTNGLFDSWISNNIISGPYAPAANNNAYYNNISTITLPTAGNIGSGNIVGTATYVDYSAVRPFFFYNDFNLTAASIGNNASTDGTDIGACGGGNIFAKEGEVKTLPIIREMDIMSPVVPSPGNVNVHIRATQPK